MKNFLNYWFVAIIFMILGLQLGDNDIKTRAKKKDVKECYTHQELEYIIYGTTQK